MVRAVLLGILSSVFFSATFIINRSINITGSSWAWTASLRFMFALPLLLLLVSSRKDLKPLFVELRKRPWAWLLWGSMGGIGFYSLLSFSAVYGPAWLVAGTWQVTIVAGSLLVPLFYTNVQTEEGLQKVRNQIPYKSLKVSVVILLGVFLMQFNAAARISLSDFILGFIPVIIATFLYPLGNRKTMELSGGKLDSFQRGLGMALASLPLCFILAGYGLSTHGLPNSGQIAQSMLLALCSGVIASLLFYYATDLAKGNLAQLAAVESTQSGTMIFTVVGEVIFINGLWPSGFALIGLIIIMGGMIVNSFVRH